MRIFSDPLEALREVERELWEMGITVHPQTMQDKVIKDDENFWTKEVRGYAFKISGWSFNWEEASRVLAFLSPDKTEELVRYCKRELDDRLCGEPLNPGNAYGHRPEIWSEFLHNGKFSYTYAERLAPQLKVIMSELRTNPETRQAILNIHSNIAVHMTDPITPSHDLISIGGKERIPCSMYYQLLIREHYLELIYTMRSCDLLTHFPIDLVIALAIQYWFAHELGLEVGTFTMFIGSLHAYYKDIAARKIF